MAARLLSDRWLGLVLDGQATTARDLLTAFPSPLVTGDAELAAAAAAGVELACGSLEAAGRHLAVAEQELPSVPPDRRARSEATLAVLRLQFARQRRDVPTLAAEANRLLATVGAPQTMGLELDEDLRALALISLGTAESWTGQFADAERHLDQGMALARRIPRPNLELTGLIAHGTALTIYRSYALGEQRCMQALELAERHGWPEEPSVGGAYAVLGATMVGQARLEEAERWLSRAERTLRAEAEPRTMVPLYSARGLLELVSGRLRDAQVAFETAEQFAGLLITPGGEFRGMVRVRVLQTLVRMGETGRCERALAEMDDPERHSGPMAMERHRRGRTAHSALLAEILDLLAGKQPAPQLASLQALLEPLSETEVRVLRYLPTNLSQKEIAGQLYVSVATVKTHIHHIYAKLVVHGRRQAVDRARDLGLLAPSLRRS